MVVSYRFFGNRMLLLRYFLVSVKKELFLSQDYCTITVTIFRCLFTIFTTVQPLSGSRYDYRTVFISHGTGYNFIQKYLYRFETHFWFLFSNFFTLLIASKRLKTVIRDTSNSSASILPFFFYLFQDSHSQIWIFETVSSRRQNFLRKLI